MDIEPTFIANTRAAEPYPDIGLIRVIMAPYPSSAGHGLRNGKIVSARMRRASDGHNGSCIDGIGILAVVKKRFPKITSFRPLLIL